MPCLAGSDLRVGTVETGTNNSCLGGLGNEAVSFWFCPLIISFITACFSVCIVFLYCLAWVFYLGVSYCYGLLLFCFWVV